MKYEEMKHLVNRKVMIHTRFGYTHVGVLKTDANNIWDGSIVIENIEYTDQKKIREHIEGRWNQKKTASVALAHITSCEEFKGRKNSTPAEVYGKFLVNNE